jgi:hypothetical protein
MNGQATTLVVAMYARPVGVPNTGDTVGEKVGVTENADDLWTRLRRGISSLTPSLIVTLVLLGIVTCVALLAHAFRRNLPKSWQKSWKRHHALYKVGLVVFIALCAVLSYGGGMI